MDKRKITRLVKAADDARATLALAVQFSEPDQNIEIGRKEAAKLCKRLFREIEAIKAERIE